MLVRCLIGRRYGLIQEMRPDIAEVQVAQGQAAYLTEQEIQNYQATGDPSTPPPAPEPEKRQRRRRSTAAKK